MKDYNANNNCLTDKLCQSLCCKSCFTPEYLNAATIGGSDRIAKGEDVVFDLLAQHTDGFAFTPLTEKITILKSGVYKFDYGVTLLTPVNTAFAVTFNGAQYPLSYFGIVASNEDTDRLQLTGEFINRVSANTEVTLRNEGHDATLQGTGEFGVAVTRSYIIINKIYD